MNLKRQLQGLSQVKWENKNSRQKAKYLEKKLSLLGYKIPNYIKQGKVSDKQLVSNINKIVKGLNSRIDKQASKSTNLNSLLKSSVDTYNRKLSNIENKLSNELGLSKKELSYIQGNDIFYASRKKSFFRDDLITKKLNLENMEFQTKKDMKNFIKQVQKMTRDLKYKNFVNSLKDDTNSNMWFNDFLNKNFNSKLTEQDKHHLWNAFSHLSPIQKELYIKGELDQLREKYEDSEDTGDLNQIAINVFNRILNTIEDYRGEL